ncbi:TetR/AcrR family transcriptional regulator [Halostagnicola sp. A-GB9-2]|uniref:TetR/AcrR family transcriptional regulator n=1 Tax=Halostagnicola sp. A-GB9-2 TaxID=3048066 RepID=UPI0024BF6ECE|nr:TetR/AcrR family transcriptional regulator [Halostagnicola sp. A-GB9-2]MDJ1432593.1 TetR/AcrR family transcriptional regulator [Halostagnicola sp. A-GB9-2]
MSRDFLEDPSGTREEILAATFDTLMEHGYADLTIDKIGDEFDKSQSLIYHHYDGKDDVVLETLERLLEEHRTETFDGDIEEPREWLEEVVARPLDETIDEQKRKSLATLFELRARAIHDDDYREHFTRSDEVFEEFLADVIEEGKEQGVFRACNPVGVAGMVITVINGALVRRSTSESDDWIGDVRDEVQSYLEKCVYANDS